LRALLEATHVESILAIRSVGPGDMALNARSSG
jgi:hypothetical protein